MKQLRVIRTLKHGIVINISSYPGMTEHQAVEYEKCLDIQELWDIFEHGDMELTDVTVEIIDTEDKDKDK